MTALEIIALKIDAYAGPAPDVRPAIGVDAHELRRSTTVV